MCEGDVQKLRDLENRLAKNNFFPLYDTSQPQPKSWLTERRIHRHHQSCLMWPKIIIWSFCIHHNVMIQLHQMFSRITGLQYFCDNLDTVTNELACFHDMCEHHNEWSAKHVSPHVALHDPYFLTCSVTLDAYRRDINTSWPIYQHLANKIHIHLLYLLKNIVWWPLHSESGELSVVQRSRFRNDVLVLL